jgi:hypothetical protein
VERLSCISMPLAKIRSGRMAEKNGFGRGTASVVAEKLTNACNTCV